MEVSEIFITVISAIVFSILCFIFKIIPVPECIRCARWKKKDFEEQYELFKEAAKLQPEDLSFQRINPGEIVKPGFRPYHDTYIARKAIPYDQRKKGSPENIYLEKDLIQSLKNFRSLLLIGKPTDGKTRTLYEIIRQLPQVIVIKIKPDQEPDECALNLLKNKNVLWLMDDLHTLKEESKFTSLLTKISKKAANCVLAGTSRDAGELDNAKQFGLLSGFYPEFELKLMLRQPDEKEIEKLQQAIGNTETRTFPTIGSVVMSNHFDVMRQRFDRMREKQPLAQYCVCAFILLNEATIYPMTQERILLVLHNIFHCENISKHTLEEALDRLKEDGFVRKVLPDEVTVLEAAYITGQEAGYYYLEGTRLRAREPVADLQDLAKYLLEACDVAGVNNLAVSRYAIDQHEAAINYLEKIDNQFGESTDLPIQKQVVIALFNKGVVLNEMKRYEEAMRCYESVDERYREEIDPAIQEYVAKALFNKGVVLNEMGRYEEAARCCELADERYSRETDLAVQEWVARALINKCAALGEMERYEEAMRCYELVNERYGEMADLLIQRQVGLAFFNKGRLLEKKGNFEEAIGCYELMDKRYGKEVDPIMQTLVTAALVFKGIRFGRMGNSEGAIHSYTSVIERYAEEADLLIQRHVAAAFLHKGIELRRMGNSEGTIHSYASVIERYREETDPAIQRVVTDALTWKEKILAHTNM